jgi:agmatinase
LSLKVGEAIAAMNPTGGAGIDEYSATGLPSGLILDTNSGAISGTPDTADASTTSATVTVSDAAGNSATVAITFPAVAGLAQFAPLDIVHFDAHLDYTHHYNGAMLSHGSPIRRCHELEHVANITSVGIRSVRRAPYEEAANHGNTVITTRQFRERGPEDVADSISVGPNLYITFDVDVLDPTQAPGTGTPEVGGLFYEETRRCLERLVSRANLVAFDVVEVAPPYDLSNLTVQVAARLIADILAIRFPSRSSTAS